MVAPNAQPSPLQQHLRSSSLPPPPASSPFKNYSRIQSEVQREGFEVHKENLLGTSVVGKTKLWGAGERFESQAPFDSPAVLSQTSSKTGLRPHLPTESGAVLDGQLVRRHAQEGTRTNRMSSCEKKYPSGSNAFEQLPASSVVPGLQGPDVSSEGKHFCSKVFPEGSNVMSSGFAIPSSHRRQDCDGLSLDMMAKRAEFRPNGGGVEENVVHAIGGLKKFNYMPVGGHKRPVQQPNFAHFEQRCSSYCVIDQNSTGTCPTSNVDNSDTGAIEWRTKIRGCIVTSCETSATTELSEVYADAGLKCFTASISAQIPESLSTFTDGEPSLSQALEHSHQQLSSKIRKTPSCKDSYSNDDWGKFLALSATQMDNHHALLDAKVFPFQQRFKQLQAFLKQCDETDQNQCLNALRSLPAAARSGHAVELETRAIRLSLEEVDGNFVFGISLYGGDVYIIGE